MSKKKVDRNKEPSPERRVLEGVDPLGFYENPPPAGLVKPRRSAVVIGAGITGLTAAHELVERGFDVTVYEKEEDLGHPGRAGVGGQAASQWTRQEFLTGTMRRTPAVVKPVIVNGPKDGAIATFAEAVRKAAEESPTYPGLHVRVTTFYDAYPDRDDEDESSAPDVQATEICCALKEAIGRTDVKVTPHVAGLPQPGKRTDYEIELAQKTALTLDQMILPGEHGFRFFPAFYHHLFDTMQRTPILDNDWKLTGRTCADALVPTTLQAVALEDGDAVVVFRRERPETLAGWMRVFDGLVGGLRFTARDVALCNSKLFQYMTSCSKRREQYEQMSWWDFLAGDRYSPEFQRQLEAVPQALVGMRATECDARTQGNATVQLLLDQFRHGERTDRTLDAPTSYAWLDHWRRYLESQGVKFELGALDKLSFSNRELEVKVESRGKKAEQLVAPSSSTTTPSPLYVVLAVPLHVLKATIACDHGGNPTLKRVVEFPEDACSAMSGIQFYLESDLELLRGHCYYPDSPWRLSSISQAQFWRHRYRLPPGIRGVVSVDVGAFDIIAPRLGKPAAGLDLDCFAEEVWKQMLDALDPGLVRRVPEPVHYHVDNAIVDASSTPVRIVAHPKRCVPFLMARPGEWRLRPGELEDYAFHRGTDSTHRGVGYEVIEGAGGQLHVVLAGVYMKTRTRLTTMEAANESGRRAVNAILEHAGVQAVPCKLFDFERMELEGTVLEDYQVLKKLDELLVERGLPHFVEILGLDSLPTPLLAGAHGSAGHHAHVRELIATLARAAGLGEQFMRDLARETGGRF